MNLFFITVFLFFTSQNPVQSVNRGSSLLSQEPDSLQVAEKVYLHIDRDIYNSGDDIWFKAYVINASTNKLSPNTNNLHADLISPDGFLKQSRTVRIENGIGKGDFTLSDTIPSGRYHIRAYTNYMRNYGNEFFFDKEIIVINPSDSGNGLSDSVKYVENKIFINFYPEGGSLVEGVSSIIAFKATDAAGRGCNITGRVISSSGEKVADLQTLHSGMGLFDLKPLAGLKYFVIFKGDDGIEYRADVPASFDSGLTLHLFVTQDYKILVKVSTNEKTLPFLTGREIRLSLSSRNLITKTTKIRINSFTNNYLIPLSDFPDGIIRVTLTSEDGFPVCERLVYLQKGENTYINISADKQEYRTRERVTMNITFPGDSITGQKAFLSLSASETKEEGDSVLFSTSIASWFLLESDVRGPVEDPSSYFDQSNEKRLEDLDLLLLTQGWRDFQWKYDTGQIYKHEIGFTVSGKVRKNSGNKPFPKAKINLALLDNRASSFFTTLADSAGIFRAEKLDIYGPARIIASVAGKNEKLTGWLYLDSAIYKPPEIYLLPLETIALRPTDYSGLKQKALNNFADRKRYKLSDTISIDEVYVTAKKPVTATEAKVQSSRLVYGKPDKEFLLTPSLQNYTSMTQVLNGRIPGVEVHEENMTLTIRGQNPLALRDGIPASIPEILMIPPSAVDRVDILYWSSPYGSQGANGIINVITRIGDFNYEALEMTHSRSIMINGFDIPRIYYAPAYVTSVSTGLTPDHRSSIHWEPDIITSVGESVPVKFYNSDQTITIQVVVEGITSTGIPLYARMKYKVN